MTLGRSAVIASSIASRVVQADGLIAFGFQEALHQPHLRWRVIDDEYFFLQHEFSEQFSADKRCTSAASFVPWIATFVALV